MNQTPNKTPEIIDVQVGQRISLLRERAGLTQVDLGKAIGVTFQQVQKYEKGTNRVSASRLVKIADYLDCSIESLFPPRDRATFEEKGVLDQMGSTHWGRELASLFVALSRDHRKTLIVVAQALAGRSPFGGAGNEEG